MNVIKFLVITLFLSVSTCFAQELGSLENTTWRGKDYINSLVMDFQVTFLKNGEAKVQNFGKLSKLVLTINNSKWSKSGNQVLLTYGNIEKNLEITTSGLKGVATNASGLSWKVEYQKIDASKELTFEQFFNARNNPQTDNTSVPNNGKQIVSLDNIENTTWRGKEIANDGGVVEYQITFLANGRLNYEFINSKTIEIGKPVVVKSSNGSWRRENNKIQYEFNSNYYEGTGEIIGNSLKGESHNKGGKTYQWEFQLSDVNKLIPLENVYSATVNIVPTSPSYISVNSPTIKNSSPSQNTNDGEINRLENEIKRLKLQNELDALKKQQQNSASSEARQAQMQEQINACLNDTNNTWQNCKMQCTLTGIAQGGLAGGANMPCVQQCDDRRNMQIDRCRSMR